ncbi:MAG: Ig-like domain-containing protein, partial [Actinomycetota bacterium]
GDVAVTDSVTVYVDASNDPPVVDAGPFQSVDEGDAVSLTATGNDPDGDTLTYAWTQVGGPAVTVTGADGANASFTAPEGITNTYLAFDVTASDGEHTVVDRVFVLVNADNDAPTLDAGADFTVDEETTVQLNATANDPEGQELMTTWRQTSGPAVVLSDTGALDPTFTAPNVLDSTELTFEVTTTDGEHTVVDTITVTVTGENDAAMPTDATTIVPEDTQPTVTRSAGDPDFGDAGEQVRVDTLPSAGTLTANGVAVQAGDTFTAAEIDSGVLQFDPPADWNGTTSLEFSAYDGEVWATDGTQSIVVQGVADAPVITAADVTVTEDASVALPVQVDLTDTDGSESISKVEITGAPNGTTFSDGSTTVTVSNGKADVSDLDLANLTISPAGDHDTDFTVTIAATSTEADSGDSTVGTTQVDVHITAVNDAPKTSDTTVQGSEDTTLSVIPKAYEVDTGDTVDSFRIDSLPENGTLMFNGSAVTAGDVLDADAVRSGQLTFEPAADWSGQTSFDFSAADDDLWSDATGTVTLDIVGVADTPILTASDVDVSEDGTTPIPLAPAVTDTDGSEAITNVTLTGAPVGTVFADGVNTV